MHNSARCQENHSSPAVTAGEKGSRPLILTAHGATPVTVLFLALLGWLLVETRDHTLLGLSERVVPARAATSSQHQAYRPAPPGDAWARGGARPTTDVDPTP